MTTRRPRSQLTILALLLQVLAIFGGAKGVVLCVGQAGHVAIEDYKAAQRCRESSAGLASDVVSGSSTVAAPPACVDTPAFVAALEQATSPARGHDVAVAVPLATTLPLAPLAAIRVARTTAPPPPSARILRSVVLLI